MTALYLAVIFFAALDRLLKAYALADLERVWNLLGKILKFNFQANYNIAFSLPLAGFWLTAVIWLVVLPLIYCLVCAWKGGRPNAAICLFAVIMGAASNLFDRLKYGYVIDYLDLKYFTVFNLADAMIVAGVVLLLFNINKKEVL